LAPESGPSLFLSYARADDEPFVERLTRDLEAREIRVWWDRQSMNNRGLTFLDEIQRAIESVDRVIAVVGPSAVKSDYVLYEWDYALLFGKAVVPILRLGDYTSIPGHLTRDLRGDHCPDFRAERPYQTALDELVRIVREPVAAFGPLRATPALPLSFLPRRAPLHAMRQALYADLDRPRPAASNAQQTLVLYGMGGSGKSVLAAAFARSMDTRRAASDGIGWLKAGRDTTPADRLANLRLLGAAFDDDPRHYTGENEARSRLPQVIADRSCLIVLDDVWRKEDAEPYLNALGPRCRLLVTTRDAALGVLGHVQALDELDDAEALTVLALSSGQPLESLPGTAVEVARACGKLPLALAMIGAMVDGNPDRWEHALHRLNTLRLDKIRFAIPNYEYTDLLLAMQVSVDDLKPEEQARYVELAAFPLGAAIPEAALRVLWEPAGVDRYDAAELVDLFVRRSLARRVAKDRIALHDLQSDYVRGHGGDLAALNGRLVDAYARHSPSGWATGPDDGYFFQLLPYHLAQAGRTAVLRDLLLSYRWLDAKLRATTVIDLIADYESLGGDAETRLVQQALQLAATALAADKAQLRSQLYARLLPFSQDGPRALVEDAERAEGPWMRALAPTLTLPGGPLIRTLTGHTGFVDAVVLFDRGRRALSASHDRTVRVWDVERGVELLKLPDETFAISRVAVTADGALAVTAAGDYSLRVWDLRERREIRRLPLPQANALALALAPGDRFAVAGLQDHTIQVWDLEDGTLAATLRGHGDGVCALAITPDGRTLVSGDHDGAIGFWDFATRQSIRLVPAHKGRIVSLFCGSEDVASSSYEGPVKVWKIASGEPSGELSGFSIYGHATNPIALRPDGSGMVLGGAGGEIGIWDFAKRAAWLLPEGHTAWITAVQVFPDSRRAISSSGDKTVKIWNLDPPAQQRRPAHAYFATRVMVKPDGQALSASPRDGVKIWNLSTLELVQSVPAPPPDRTVTMKARAGMSMQAGDFLAMAFFPDGRRCAWALQDRSVRVTELETARELARRELDGVDAMTVTPDGRHVVCVVEAGISVWDWATNRMVAEHTIGGRYNWVEVSPDGSRLLTSAWFGRSIDVRELLTGRLLYSRELHGRGVNAVALSPDGTTGYSASDDETVRAWDFTSGDERMVFAGPRGAVHALAVSPDGSRLVSGSEDGTLTVWNAADGTSIATFAGDTPFRSCTVAPDELIVAGDSLGRVHFVRLCP